MLISENYRRLNASLHKSNPHYGAGADSRAQLVRQITSEYRSNDVLDYGCGKGFLRRALQPLISVKEYDPAIEGKDGPPEPADIVVCLDVLEHVEPECLDHVLDHIQSLTVKVAALLVHTSAALKVLDDGRNAHLTQQRLPWWRDKLDARWKCRHAKEGNHHFLYIGEAKCFKSS